MMTYGTEDDTIRHPALLAERLATLRETADYIEGWLLAAVRSSAPVQGPDHLTWSYLQAQLRNLSRSASSLTGL